MEKRESLIFQENLAFDPPRLVRVRCCGLVPYCRSIFILLKRELGVPLCLKTDCVD